MGAKLRVAISRETLCRVTEPRRPENSVRARILVLPTARGNSS